jgi:hypothetical protein
MSPAGVVVQAGENVGAGLENQVLFMALPVPKFMFGCWIYEMKCNAL